MLSIYFAKKMRKIVEERTHKLQFLLNLVCIYDRHILEWNQSEKGGIFEIGRENGSYLDQNWCTIWEMHCLLFPIGHHTDLFTTKHPKRSLVFFTHFLPLSSYNFYPVWKIGFLWNGVRIEWSCYQNSQHNALNMLKTWLS